ncbi:MAG: YqjF family protein, partial [Terrimicrobiaceae bacterium]
MSPVANPRPSPGPVVMRQRWEDLLFLHWDWDPVTVQNTLPPGLEVDAWNGRAYIGLVPFFMRGVRPAGLPALPWISNFLELNIRTYVRDRHGRAGVWFYSLDCNQPLAVWVARTLFHLPYFDARMRARRGGGSVDYECQRVGHRVSSAFRYEVTGPAAPASTGSL